MRKFIIICIALYIIGCGSTKNDSNQITIFHAGSLSAPFKALADSFIKTHPQATILLEAAGSVECSRKITELNRKCDLIASADYKVIDKLLIPQYAEWNVLFAGNEMVIAFTLKSKSASIIDSTNWFKIVLEPSVYFGRSDPDSDPCGYRTLQIFQLTEKYYQLNGFYSSVIKKDKRFIRPKEVDLLALLQSGAIDYLFIYKSVALQHHLKFVELPKKINLGYIEHAEFYSQARVNIKGSKPNSTVEMNGEPMVYGFSIPNNVQNRELAEEFAKFILGSKGTEILNSLGMPTLQPQYSPASHNKNLNVLKYAE